MKKCFLWILLTVLSFSSLWAASAQTTAEPATPYYKIEVKKSDIGYTAEVYLMNGARMRNGGFGIRFYSSLKDKITCKINEDIFEPIYPLDLSNPLSYYAIEWTTAYGEESDQDLVLTDRELFATFEIASEDVDDHAVSQMNWMLTDRAKLPIYDEEQGGYLNAFTWRDATPEERSQWKISGFYQGKIILDDFDNTDIDTDIGFVIESEAPPAEMEQISGTVQAWNPNHDIWVTLYDNEGVGTDRYYAGDELIGQVNGRCSWDFAVQRPKGERTESVGIAKKAHLTNQLQTLEVTGDGHSFGSQQLYCGDIDGDQGIKMSDRSALIRAMAKVPEELSLLDLNGDGLLTIADLNILKMYYNKTYVN